MSALNKLGQGGFSIGLELPLDNDWSSSGRQANAASSRVSGEPDLLRHAELARLAANHETIFAPHFPFPGIGTIKAVGDHFVWQAAN